MGKIGSVVKKGFKKVVGALKEGFLSSATPESVQKPKKPETKTNKTGFKEGLKKSAVKVVKGWHKGLR